MKFGGQSWNKSPKKKPGMITRFICKYCKRNYKVDWARKNHEKLCKEHYDEM